MFVKRRADGNFVEAGRPDVIVNMGSSDTVGYSGTNVPSIFIDSSMKETPSPKRVEVFIVVKNNLDRTALADTELLKLNIYDFRKREEKFFKFEIGENFQLEENIMFGRDLGNAFVLNFNSISSWHGRLHIYIPQGTSQLVFEFIDTSSNGSYDYQKREFFKKKAVILKSGNKIGIGPLSEDLIKPNKALVAYDVEFKFNVIN